MNFFSRNQAFPKNSRKENFFIISILILLLVIFFYDVVLLGKTFKVSTANAQALPYGVYGQKFNRPAFIPVNGTDASVLEEPIYEFIKQNLKKGILPLWNPHQACGYPLIAMMSVGMFFPLHFILYLLPQLFAWDVMILTRLLCAGLFTYWMMRTFRFSMLASLTSAIVFMLTGPMVLLQYWTANVEIIAPLLILSLERLIRTSSRKNLCFVAFTFALTFIAGHAEHVFFVNVLGFLFFCFRIFSTPQEIDRKKILGYLGLAYLLGLGLSAMVFLPFLRNFITESWSNHPGGVGSKLEEIRIRMITLALPHFFQKESLTYGFSFAGWWGGYLGIFPLALAFLSLFGKQRKGLNYFLAVMAFILIGLAYSFPVIRWIGYLPIFSLCRFAIHTPYLVALTVAILAGMGIRSVEVNKRVFQKGLIFSSALLLTIGIHLFVFRKAEHWQQSLKASLFAVSILIVFLVILFAKDKKWFSTKFISLLLVIFTTLELFLYIHRERPRRFDSFPKVPYMEFLKK